MPRSLPDDLSHPIIMRRLLPHALLLMTVPLLAQNQPPPPSPTTLAQLKDHFRPLLLFAPSPDDPGLRAQLTRLHDDAPGLSERDVLVIAVPFHNPAPTDTGLTPADAEAARRRFHIAPNDFTVLLIGKDGGEKLRSGKPVSFNKLRDIIDGMPMRQREMHHSRE